VRILVTGGAGFIGSHVVDRYVELGHDVAVLDDLSTGNRANVNPEATLYEMSLRDGPLARAFEEFRPEVVNHHAAQVNVRKSVDDPGFDASTNIVGSIRLYEAAVKAGCRKVIYISSGGASYGEPENIPASEDTPVRPLCPYGASKFTAELYLALYGRLYGLPYTVLRYANVYGPRQDPHGEAGVVAIFSEMMLRGKRPSIFGDGTKTRDYVFVEDIAEANVLALDKGEGRSYNVGTGREFTDDEVFEAVRAAAGVDMKPNYADFRKGEILRIALDASRIHKELGWTAKTPLEIGIPKAVAFYRKKLGMA
jgi:UDP-glucose 4-epimerase